MMLKIGLKNSLKKYKAQNQQQSLNYSALSTVKSSNQDDDTGITSESSRFNTILNNVLKASEDPKVIQALMENESFQEACGAALADADILLVSEPRSKDEDLPSPKLESATFSVSPNNLETRVQYKEVANEGNAQSGAHQHQSGGNRGAAYVPQPFFSKYLPQLSQSVRPVILLEGFTTLLVLSQVILNRFPQIHDYICDQLAIVFLRIVDKIESFKEVVVTREVL